MLTDKELRAILPPRERWPESPRVHTTFNSVLNQNKKRKFSIWPWSRRPWWNLSRRARIGNDWVEICRVYLNGSGTDDELRFLVADHTRKELPCYRCAGTGRVPGAGYETGGFLGFPKRRVEPDENGKVPCLLCLEKKTVKPLFGASNDFCNAPGISAHLSLDSMRRLGGRGLANPTTEEVVGVMKWCDDVLWGIYGPLHLRRLDIRDKGRVDTCAFCGAWPHLPHSGTCMDRTERLNRQVGKIPFGKIA
jgi:hypothetical protein